MADQTTQVIRRTANSWDVERTKELAERTWEYETIGKIVYQDGLFYAEVTVWKEEGYEFKRHPRGFQLLKGALRFLTHPDKKFN